LTGRSKGRSKAHSAKAIDVPVRLAIDGPNGQFEVTLSLITM
jgi:hypothetical protein